jgi:GWxTD domain-containing protein
MKNRFGSLFVVLVLFSTASLGQSRRYVEIAARYMNSQVYHEWLALPGEEGADLHILFRIPNDLVIFMRNRDAEPDREFVAELVVTAEIYKDREKVGEEVWRGQHFAATYDQTLNRDLDLQGHLEYKLDAGTYAYRLRISDENAERESVLPLRRFSVPEYGDSAAGRGFIINSVEEKTDETTLLPTNLGGNAAFGESAFAAVPISLPHDVHPETIVVEKRLRKMDENDLEREIRDRQKVVERARRRRNDDQMFFEPELQLEGGESVSSEEGFLSHQWIPVGSDTEVRSETGRLVFPRPVDERAWYLLVIDLGGESLANGTYVLQTAVTVSGEDRTSRTRFSTHWRNMPFSLNDPDVAIENLEFILKKSDVRAMRRGSRADKIKRFEAFWKERDPTPDTEYNELLNEYYRRIDHAAFTFRTGAEALPNGLKSDRSRVYIVEGPPDDVLRDFPPGGGVRETWTYDDGRKFVFMAGSSVDEYKLVRSS